MGSIVISDVFAADIARYPHTMVVGDLCYQENTQAKTNQTHNSNSSQPSKSFSQQQRLPSSASLHSQNAGGSSSNTIRPTSTPQVTTPRDIPASRGGLQSPAESEGDYSGTFQGHREEDGFDRSGFPLTSAPRGLASTPPSPRLLPTMRSSLSLAGSGSGSPNRIKVRDLSHIQAFASEEVLTRSHGSRASMKFRHEAGQQYEISSMPVSDIIEMVAGLLTKITTTNDRQHQHEHIHRHIPSPEGTSALSQQTASVLSFHGKNVPSITILSYLSRIHKYCPTTYEVFLSLLVYFDRMTEMINNHTLKSFKSSAKNSGKSLLSPESSTSLASEGQKQAASSNAIATPPPSSGLEPQPDPDSPSIPSAPESDDDASKLAHCFVVDSFNIHRLVIAGVTCASKFFSDVFYTNSRYAKVRCSPPVLKANPHANRADRSAAYLSTNLIIWNYSSCCWTTFDFLFR